MKIVRVEALPVSLAVEPYSDRYGKYSELNYVLAKVQTDQGISGIGEASPIDASFYGETQHSIVAIIERFISPLVNGEDPLEIERLEKSIDQKVAGNNCAKTALDIALYDLAGKALGQPVHVLLGGQFRKKAPIGLELGITDPKQMSEKATKLLEMGAKAIKLHVGVSPETDIQAIRALHDSVGDGAAIRADANGAYTTAEAIHVLRKVETCELEYFEQPVTGANIDGLRRIKQVVDTPIAVDESVWTPEDAVEVCKREAADVINIKVTRVGGLNKAKKIAQIAEAFFLKSHVGCEVEFGVAMAAKVHLALCLVNATCASAGEFTEIAWLRDNIVRASLQVKDGYIEANDKPGLGIELDEEKVKRYTTKAKPIS